jgi:hypothetical protein
MLKAIKTTEVYIPSLMGGVLLKEMTSEERDAFEIGMLDYKGKANLPALYNFRGRFVALHLVKSDGGPMFTAAELGEFPAYIMTELFNECRFIYPDKCSRRERIKLWFRRFGIRVPNYSLIGE